ncbi:unnamed protein product [marine sediment metagenome]|uniref:Uncharacterized protein n=1 Tax=marine sediment metagenome TaxID=412755 RepID=X1JF41_9ZZZZ
MSVHYYGKKSPVGAGETNTIIPIGVGKWEILAASIQPDVDVSTSCRLVYGVKVGGATKHVHLVSGIATSKLPLCLSATREVEGPGGIVATAIHGGATDFHTLYAAIRRIRR